MSWLLSKVFGGGAPKTPEKADGKYDDDQDEEEQQAAPPTLSDDPVDYSSLTFSSHEELCRASITFSRWTSDQAPLSVKSRHALLVLLRLNDSYDSELRIYLTAGEPAVVTPVTGQLWYDVVKVEHALLFGVVQGPSRVFFHCRFHDAEEEKSAILHLSIAVWEHAQQDSFTKSIKDTKWSTTHSPHTTTSTLTQHPHLHVLSSSSLILPSHLCFPV